MITNMNIALAGIVGGIVVSVWAMIMNKLGFTQMSMNSYMGCMITQQSTGLISFLSGMMAHFTLSIVFAFIYSWAFQFLHLIPNLMTGIKLGCIHWFIAGMMLPLMDLLNVCVKKGFIKSMKFYAYGYGISGVLTFLIAHLLYGSVVCVFLQKI